MAITRLTVAKRPVFLSDCTKGDPICIDVTDCGVVTSCCPTPLPSKFHVTVTTICNGGCTTVISVPYNGGTWWIGSVLVNCDNFGSNISSTYVQIECRGFDGVNVLFVVQVLWGNLIAGNGSGCAATAYITVPCIGPYSGSQTVPILLNFFGRQCGACTDFDAGGSVTITLTL